MDIEVQVTSGNRVVSDDGSVSWEDMQRRSHVVTYLKDTRAAKKEILYATDELLQLIKDQ